MGALAGKTPAIWQLILITNNKIYNNSYLYHDSYIGLIVSVQQYMYRFWTLDRIIVLLGKTLLFALTEPLW